jgi:hypothetical protein
LPISFLVYYFSSPRSSLLFKFESAFEVIKKNNRDCKETLKKYNFKKLRREACTSEQVGSIFIFDTKE